MNELALFAGAGGGILGGKLLGWRTVCAVEWDSYAASVLAARQNDGILPTFPIWDDVQTFDGKPWRGIVDVISGGFPCQDISIAGKGAGLSGQRSGMWHHMARVVSEVRPKYVYIENSPMLAIRGGVRVIEDLTSLGYDCEWDVMGAADVGAPHKRDRIWILAYSNGMRKLQSERGQRDQRRWVGDSGCKVAYANSTQCEGNQCSERTQPQYSNINSPSWWSIEPNVGRVANGVAARMDRLKAIGNGQVPLCAATAWGILNAS